MPRIVMLGSSSRGKKVSIVSHSLYAWLLLTICEIPDRDKSVRQLKDISNQNQLSPGCLRRTAVPGEVLRHIRQPMVAQSYQRRQPDIGGEERLRFRTDAWSVPMPTVHGQVCLRDNTVVSTPPADLRSAKKAPMAP